MAIKMAPTTIEETLATGELDPDFEAAARSKPEMPVPEDITVLKSMVQSSLPTVQKQLVGSRLEGVVEAEKTVLLATGFESRIIICSPSNVEPDASSPVIVLFHGGGYCLGFPELELELARKVVIAHNATVICPSIRLAPDDPFPAGVNDGWAMIQHIAKQSKASSDPKDRVLTEGADPRHGFIVGGTSSGANLAAVIAHLAKDEKLYPPITGQFLSAVGVIAPEHVLAKYQPHFLSWTQCENGPVVTKSLHRKFRDALNQDLNSPLYAPIVQSGLASEELWKGHLSLPRTYFQVCGADMSRDDALIYEKVLREDCGVETKLDLYAGWPHCWWNVHPNLAMSLQRTEDSIEAFRWLLRV